MIRRFTKSNLTNLFRETLEDAEDGITSMVQEACNGTNTWENGVWHLTDSELRRFAALVVKAESYNVAFWMMDRGFITRDRESIEELLQELERQVCDIIKDIIEAHVTRLQEKNGE